MAEASVDWFSDQDLIAAALDGDRGAFGLLASRHRDLAFGVAQRLLGDPQAAEDAVQEAVVVAMVSLARLQRRERFGAWLCGITVNIARRWIRDQRRSTRLRFDLASDEIPDPGLGPEERALLDDLAVRVRDAVAHLAPGQREAVLGFYLDGLTLREVAQELGISAGAVKARLHEARSALKPTLATLGEAAERKERAVETDSREWIAVHITEVRRSERPEQSNAWAHERGLTSRRLHVVVLEDESRTRQLPIWIGPFEASALACTLESLEMPRPMTYQLVANLVAASGGTVREVRITRLAEGTFYAAILVDGGSEPREVDARPSDALNVALIAGSPILVDAAVLADPACRRDEWRRYADSTSDIVAAVREDQTRIRHTLEALVQEATQPNQHETS